MEFLKAEIPFSLRLNQVAQILGVKLADVRLLMRSGEIEAFTDPCGPRIRTQSVIDFLGRVEFKRRWPSFLGDVRFEAKDE